MTAREKALAALAAHRAAEQAAQDRIERERVQLVADARTAGATWKQIGEAINQKASNANRKYKPQIEETGTRQWRVKPTDTSSEE